MALAALGFLVYLNTLGNPFILDDQNSIVNNRTIQGPATISALLNPPRDTPVAGRPVVNLSFAVNHAFGGIQVGGYHVVNIAIHVLAALVLFGVVRRPLGTARIPPPLQQRSTGLAAACAFIWLLHPLQTEVVDYLTQRTESLMGFFFLLTLYAAIRAADSQDDRKWPVIATVACALGMASKESMVTAPVIVALYDRTFLYPTLSTAFRSRAKLYVALASTWLLLLALNWSGPRSGSTGFASDVGTWTYLLNQPAILLRYLALAFWPHGLVVDYGIPLTLTVADVWLPGLVVLVLLFATMALLVRWPLWGFLAAWFFITLSPTSSVIPIATEVGAERRMYLPLAALVIATVIAVQALADRFSFKHTAALLAVVCAILATGTVLRNREYSSPLLLATTLVERRPHGRAHYILATELLTAGRSSEAMGHLQQSARDYPGARFALGTELIAAGKRDEGLAHLQAFVERYPSHVNTLPAREMIGRVLTAEGKLDAAIDQYNLILRMAPRYADAHGYVGDIYLTQGRYGDAIPHYEELLKLRPSGRAQSNLGLALAASGRLDEALAAFQRAIELDPRDANSQRNLARVQLQKQLFADAATHARLAVDINPADAQAYDVLGLALASQNQLGEAVTHFRRSLQLQPNPETEEHLNRALRLLATGRP